MISIIFSEKEKTQILKHNLELDQVKRQIEIFVNGLPFIILDRPCTPGDGILYLQPADFDEFRRLHSVAALSGRFSKFVPASGAASRMFKELAIFLRKYPDINTLGQLKNESKKGDKTLIFVNRFLRNIKHFAFYSLLKESLKDHNHDIEVILESGNIREILLHLLNDKHLGYLNKPKGLIPFHIRDNQLLTPFAEHLFEAYSYTKSESGKCRIHFTISPKHLGEVEKHIDELKNKYSEAGVSFSIDFSEQHNSTDTVAVTLDNNLYHDSQGNLLFRPAGHGALLQNLNEMDGDIVYIKNIDNIVPENKCDDTHKYKILLGGLLVKLQNRVFEFLNALDHQHIELENTDVIREWASSNLNVSFPKNWKDQDLSSRVSTLKKALNRPLRVCGMVKNLGQPGGGPFWIQSEDRTISPQIIESSQIDHKNPDQEKIAQAATHFNPVDLVCGLRDYKGNPFNLEEFVDPKTGFISEKSVNGKIIKALELPGLWNGAMAGWNTVFVDVPISTFSPVKTVNDLLSEDHK